MSDPPSRVSRVIRSRQAAQSNYDRLARIYAGLAASEEPFRRKAVDLLRAQTGECVLEIGCGSGTSLAVLSQRGLHPHGIDLSFEMLRETRKRMPVDPLLCQGDGLYLPYPTGCFDALLLTFTLELFDTPEVPQVLAECRRVLVQGGRVSIAALVSPEPPATHAAPVRIYEWFHERLPALVDCRPIPLQRLLEQAGFAIEEKFAAGMWGLPVEVVLAKI